MPCSDRDDILTFSKVVCHFHHFYHLGSFWCCKKNNCIIFLSSNDRPSYLVILICIEGGHSIYVIPYPHLNGHTALVMLVKLLL